MAKIKPTQPIYEKVLVEDSPERQLLLSVARLRISDADKEKIKELVNRDLEWETIIDHSMLHGIAGLMYKHLESMRDEVEVPKDILWKLKRAYLMFTASGLRLESQYKAIAKRLADTDTDIIVLKGLTLVKNLYKDFGLRPMSDVDILIRERDWPVVFKTMEDLGYKQRTTSMPSGIPAKLTKYDVKSHISFLLTDKSPIEFQFDLFTLGIGMIDIEGVWRRSKESTLAGERVRELGKEDMLLSLIVHANRHGCSRLKWLVDIAEMLNRTSDANWDEFVRIAERERVKASVYSTIKHVESIYGKRDVPVEVMESLKPNKIQRHLWKAVWPQKELNDFRGRHEDAITFYYYRPLSGWNIINCLMMGRTLSKLAYMIRFMVPPPEWMSERYGEIDASALLKHYFRRIVIRDSKVKQKGKTV